MKKILITGVVVLLAMLFVTCDMLFPDEDDEIEYTDVVYSKDGSTVTVYLDGVGVPITKSAKRALTTDLAKIAYDYLEVLFIGGLANARSSWELGQSAGISGVYRGVSGTGNSYLWVSGATTNTAVMFVGRKDTKLLLGIGRIGAVNTPPAGTNVWPAPAAISIDKDTESVTFYIEAIKTALVAADTAPGVVDSFDFTLGAGATASSVPTWNREDNSSYIYLGSSPSVPYPMYALPQKKDTPSVPGPQIDNPIQNATYTFGGAAETFAKEIKLYAPVNVERRLPRYLDGGRYYSPKGANFDIKSKVVIDPAYVQTAGTSFVNVIPLIFTTFGNGIFSFYIETTVYMINNLPATNSGPDAERWKLRTGFGSELVSLDDGVDGLGGCVLMGVGNTGTDWIDIEWEWVLP